MSDDIRVSFMNVIAEYYPSLKSGGRNFLFGLYFAVSISNILSSFALILYLNHGNDIGKNLDAR
eukprot:CAMPEP_0170087196 /NCGR_PEP_ID=MMETSP0019_2-20121128/21733_1 /TAXON_ID=98059 /ORGANISM="Dinobryon sp., Strain UTEXLB2267" /LENGTH=63 /DNA_ID=CAMNT_0010304723 /DNA_START=27 /DNA_END=215 /DNA_ORIENTATION=+